MRITQADRVLLRIREHGFINWKIAMEMGISQLAYVIHTLKNMGYTFTKKGRFTSEGRLMWEDYFLESEPAKEEQKKDLTLF